MMQELMSAHEISDFIGSHPVSHPVSCIPILDMIDSYLIELKQISEQAETGMNEQDQHFNGEAQLTDTQSFKQKPEQQRYITKQPQQQKKSHNSQATIKNKSGQSEKKNFPHFLASQIIQNIEINDFQQHSMQKIYLQFVCMKIKMKKTKKILEDVLIGEKNDKKLLCQLQKKFAKSTYQGKMDFEGDDWDNSLMKTIQHCKRELRGLIYDKKDQILKKASQRMKLTKEARDLYVTYVGDYLEEIHKNKVRGKDVKKGRRSD